jgi:hypothetical protein
MQTIKIPVSLPKHRKIAFASAVIFASMIILFLLFTTYEIPDPKPEVYVTKGFTEIDNVQIETLTAVADPGGSAGGTPADGPLNNVEPTPQIVQTPTSSKGKTTVPKGDGKTTYKPDQKPNNKPKDPFAKPGSKGAGTGKDKFGNDYGPGSGKGPGDNDGPGQGIGPDKGAKPRAKISSPSDDGIDANENCKVVFMVTYNAAGNVINAQSVPSACTTTDNNVISQAKQVILRNLKFAPLDGAPDVKVRYTLNIKAK